MIESSQTSVNSGAGGRDRTPNLRFTKRKRLVQCVSERVVEQSTSQATVSSSVAECHGRSCVWSSDHGLRGAISRLSDERIACWQRPTASAGGWSIGYKAPLYAWVASGCVGCRQGCCQKQLGALISS